MTDDEKLYVLEQTIRALTADQGRGLAYVIEQGDRLLVNYYTREALATHQPAGVREQPERILEWIETYDPATHYVLVLVTPLDKPGPMQRAEALPMLARYADPPGMASTA